MYMELDITRVIRLHLAHHPPQASLPSQLPRVYNIRASSRAVAGSSAGATIDMALWASGAGPKSPARRMCLVNVHARAFMIHRGTHRLYI
jgi:hypothetical protein